MVNKHTKRKRAKSVEKKRVEEEEFVKLPSDDSDSNVIYIGMYFPYHTISPSHLNHPTHTQVIYPMDSMKSRWLDFSVSSVR
jgi:hypothetical protein